MPRTKLAIFLLVLAGVTGCLAAPDPAGDDDSVQDAGDDDSGAASDDDTTWPDVDPDQLDQDGDGWTPAGGDCNDLRETIYPGAPEACNMVDDDCDGGLPAWEYECWWAMQDDDDSAADDDDSAVAGDDDSGAASPCWSLHFDGMDDYVSTPDTVAGTPAGTVEVWFRADAWDGIPTLWSSGIDVPAESGYTPMTLGAAAPATGDIPTLLFRVYNDAPGQAWHITTSAVVPSVGLWHHAAGSWGPSGISVYLDGALLGTNPYAEPAPTTGMNLDLIGSTSWANVSQFAGDIAAVRLSSTNLYGTATFAPPWPLVPEGDTLALYDFAGGAATPPADANIVGPTWTEGCPF